MNNWHRQQFLLYHTKNFTLPIGNTRHKAMRWPSVPKVMRLRPTDYTYHLGVTIYNKQGALSG